MGRVYPLCRECFKGMLIYTTDPMVSSQWYFECDKCYQRYDLVPRKDPAVHEK